MRTCMRVPARECCIGLLSCRADSRSMSCYHCRTDEQHVKTRRLAFDENNEFIKLQYRHTQRQPTCSEQTADAIRQPSLPSLTGHRTHTWTQREGMRRAHGALRERRAAGCVHVTPRSLCRRGRRSQPHHRPARLDGCGLRGIVCLLTQPVAKACAEARLGRQPVSEEQHQMTHDNKV